MDAWIVRYRNVNEPWVYTIGRVYYDLAAADRQVNKLKSIGLAAWIEERDYK